MIRTVGLAMLAVAIALGFGHETSWALDPDRSTTQYIRDRWSTDRGFPGGSVEAIAQTADGALWIGTDLGLVQYDGNTFRTVTESDPAAPPIVGVLGLTTDAAGNLLVRLPGRNFLRYAGGSFENALWPLRPREVAVTAMSRNRDGSVLLGAIAHGVMRYRDGQFEPLAAATALPRSPIVAIAEAGDGAIWIGTRDDGLFVLAKGQVTAVTGPLPSRQINALLPVGGHDVWIATDRGLARWDGDAVRTDGIPQVLASKEALSLLVDRAGNLWFGTSEGLWRMNEAGVTRLAEDRGQAAVSALFEDREGNLWAGRNGSIERVRDSRFVTYTRAEGLPSERNGPVYVDLSGRTWFAPLSGGLYWMADGRVHQVTGDGLDRDVVYSITGTGTDVWVGRQHGGLSRLRMVARADEGPAEIETIARRDGIADDSVFVALAARDGAVWAGTLEHGASVWRNGTVTRHDATSGLPADAVSAIIESSDSTIWLGTSNGLAHFAGNRWQTVRQADGLPSSDITALFEDRHGRLWVGTADGLGLVVDGRPLPLRALPAMLDEQIIGLAEDASGSLWIATMSHVVQVEIERLLAGAASGPALREYGLADGLHSVEGVKRQRSVIADPSGRVWFSTSGGISVTDPKWASGGGVPSRARVGMVTADGTPVAINDGAARIAPGSRRITFGYSGISLSVPERVRFRYKLDGFDRDWSAPATTREAVYTNLGPGTYRFHVMSSNSEGLWNGAEDALAIHVDPQFWQTWWFRTLFAITLCTAIAGAYRARMRRTADQLNVRFQERLAERTRIAQELHDTLLQGFVSAAMQLHVASNRLPPESPARPALNGVMELMSRVIEEGRNAVRGLRTTSDQNSDDLEQAFCRIQQEFSVAERTNFRVVVEGRVRALHPMVHDEAYRVGREALANALRHSGASTIEVELDYAPQQFRLLVRDNGAGISSDLLHAGRDGHWGLSGMRERADRIGARLKVWSREGAGTEIELSIPGRVAYRSAPHVPGTIRSGSSL